jgi:hypothetical protein
MSKEVEQLKQALDFANSSACFNCSTSFDTLL